MQNFRNGNSDLYTEESFQLGAAAPENRLTP